MCGFRERVPHPILVGGRDGQEIIAGLAKVKPELRAFLVDYTSRLVK